ncbi:bactericidal permeability-increasing protein-like [Ptychodera flava]|uniref:bactericidal permeability-increasing protein-like n=1 Tax=Ptychodera flava TaxID=63121 RepID=UPI00396A4430
MLLIKLACLYFVIGCVYGSNTTTAEPTPPVEKNPGIIGRFTKSGFDNIINNVARQFSDEVSKNALPDHKGSFRRFFVRVFYSATRMQIVQFDMPEADLSPVPGKGLKLKISDAYTTVTGHWLYAFTTRWLGARVRDDGTFLVIADDIDLDLELLFDMDEYGYPNMTVGNCTADIGDVDIQLSGGASWFYNPFAKSIASAIKTDIVDRVCDEISVYVGQFAEKLQSLPMSAPIIKGVLDIDFALVNPPVFTEDYVDIGVTGTVSVADSDDEIPFEAVPIERDDVSSKMMYIWVTDYVYNTFGYSLYKSGTMKYALDPQNIDIIPKESEFHKLLPLKLADFEILFPGLIKTLPDPELFLLFELAAPPTFNTTVEGQLVTASVAVSLRVNEVNATEDDDVIAIIMDAQVLVKPTMENERMTAVTELQWLRSKLTRSVFPDVLNGKIEDMMDSALHVLTEDVGLPWLNTVAALDFPVVDDNWQHINSKVTTHQGYLLVETDFGAIPPSFS